MAMASAGFRLKAILALAMCGDAPAPLIIFLKKPVEAPAAFLACSSAQGAAAVEKGRLLLQDLAEQRDGVIGVLPLGSFPGLDIKPPHVRRYLIQ